MQIKILRLKEVQNRTGLGRSSLYFLVSSSKFPAPIHIGRRSVGWIEDEVEKWILERIVLSRGGSSLVKETGETL